MSYAVTLRTREIGIRVALGADRGAVLLMVAKEVALLAGLGVLLGLPAGYGLGRLAEAQLFGLAAGDPPTFALATAALLLTALVASCVPALRASRVDPMVALRRLADRRRRAAPGPHINREPESGTRTRVDPPTGPG